MTIDHDPMEDETAPIELDESNELDEKLPLGEFKADPCDTRWTGRPGRPRATVFPAIPGTSKMSLVLRRKVLLGRFSFWRATDNLEERIDWRKRERAGEPDWEIYRDAQFAMVVSGRKWPESRTKVHSTTKHYSS